MMIDAHQHFWSLPLDRYPWMSHELAKIRRPFGPDDLASVLKAEGVESTVVVQARADLEETRELLELAARTPFVAGVVGWADLSDSHISATLHELKTGATGAKLIGIRHQVQDEADPAWLLRPAVQRGIAAVGEAGLAYDFLVRTRELPAALETARRFPQVRFVIDHLAKPPIGGGDVDAWAEVMRGFSQLPNVSCKLSGMVTEADWATWRPEQLRPFVLRVLDWFGPERSMFGSDWPVCLLAASYEQVVDALRFCLHSIGETAMAAVFGQNARRFYRLA